MPDSRAIKKWLKYAQNDLLVAKELSLQHEYVYRAVLMHAQQSVEKYLKAYLLRKNVEIKKTHDLIFLNKLCEKVNKDFSVHEEALAWLSAVYMESRYPDDFEDIDKADAEKALKIAEEIEKFILEKLES